MDRNLVLALEAIAYAQIVAAGMVAENDRRKSLDLAQAYTEETISSVAAEMRARVMELTSQ